MYHAGPGEWPKKLQTPNQALWYCLAVHKLKILANVLLGMRELRNRPPKKSDFVYSRTKLLPTNSSSYWATLTQNDIAFVVVAPFSPFVCRVAVLANCVSAKFYGIVMRNKMTKTDFFGGKFSAPANSKVRFNQSACFGVLQLLWPLSCSMTIMR